ncbi:MAG: 50S ribosomal protein L21 [Deltaproteobacteria bacterium]|jgi:large subunit ribosomal protein L21|nr:50S ribosomal protein L21 [Deltaproteobacteria bacterium]
MYAIVEEGGRQYQVSVGQTVKVNRLAAKVGDEITLGRVLLVKDDAGVKAGPGLLAEVSVTGKVTRLERGPKILVFKKKRRKGYHKSQGHRQNLTAVLVTSIGEASARETETAPEATTEAASEASTEAAPEASTEAAPEASTEAAPEAATEAAPEAATEESDVTAEAGPGTESDPGSDS